MKSVSVKVSDEEYSKLQEILAQENMDVPTLFLSSVGIRSSRFIPTYAFLKRRIKNRIAKGEEFTLVSLFSKDEYDSLAPSDKAAAGRKLEKIVSKARSIERLIGLKEGRIRYRRLP